MDTYARQLIDAVDRVVGPWVDRSVRSVAAAQGLVIGDDAETSITRAADTTRREVHDNLVALLELDVDLQRGNPLDVLRRSVVHATQVLRNMGARPVDRDEFAERVFPDDVYALSPASFAEVDESLVEPGIIWGASKAKTVLDRRRAEGRRPERDN